MCCVPRGLGRTLLAQTYEELTSCKNQTIYFFGASEVDLSLSVLEKLHERNRHSADPSSHFHTFQSQFVNREVRLTKGVPDPYMHFGAIWFTPAMLGPYSGQRVILPNICFSMCFCEKYLAHGSEFFPKHASA